MPLAHADRGGDIVRSKARASGDSINVVVNWLAELRAKVGR
jgi:hypothetical protein